MLVQSFVQERNIRIFEIESRIVPRRKVIEVNPEFASSVLQSSELDALIAANARIRRSPCTVFCTEIVENFPLVIFGDWNNVMKNPETLGNELCFFDILVFARAIATLATFCRRHFYGTVPRCHRHADNFVPLLF